MQIWNPWHGCHKISPGCHNCYVYRRDAKFSKDSSIIKKTNNFNLPLKKKRTGEYKLVADGTAVFTCGTSDFFIEEADLWREEAWRFIKARPDLDFMIITKRINRFKDCLPQDWGEGYKNVIIGCTCEDQKRTDERLPVFFDQPIHRRLIIHEPMLAEINLEPYLQTYADKIEQVICGGESGDCARVCDYGWILNTLSQCVKYGVPFHFKQTGTKFKRGRRIYYIERKHQHTQACKAGIDYSGGLIEAKNYERAGL